MAASELGTRILVAVTGILMFLMAAGFVIEQPDQGTAAAAVDEPAVSDSDQGTAAAAADEPKVSSDVAAR